ncbi:MAG: ABC transporter ATP-binding protein [Halodesulfurarchaeum sp.]
MLPGDVAPTARRPIDTTPVEDRPARIRVENLAKTYRSGEGDISALEGFDLTVHEREFFCLLGPSGCGKSTFLRLVGGLLEPDEGQITFEGPDSHGPRTNLVFQEQGIFPWKTVIDNVAFGLKMRGVGKNERYGIAREYIRKVTLEDFETAYPHQLSGGMKQRVGIARAFANDPEILLMDEPFGALDAQTKRYLQEELVNLWNESRKTVIYVTHDIEEAIRLGDRLGVMTDRPGRITALIDVDLQRPRTRERIDLGRLETLQRRVWSILDEAVEGSVDRESP